jgi:hypothetical protein
MKPRASPPVFEGRLHDAHMATSIGRWLGPASALRFVDRARQPHLQHPPGWLVDHIPSRPSWGYRVTQGRHVASGIFAIPLLLAKLWTVSPRLFEWPPLRSARHALERLSVAMVVAGAVFELATGLLNTIQWYPWPLPFIPMHYAVARLVTGGPGGAHRGQCPLDPGALEPPAAPRDARSAGPGRRRPPVVADGGGRGRRSRRPHHGGSVRHPAEGPHPVRAPPSRPRPAGPARQPHRRGRGRPGRR